MTEQFDLTEAFDLDDTLPDPLPEDPFPLFEQWFEDARERGDVPNPNAMSLCTIDPDGRPSGRIVLCKQISIENGYIVFYTNRKSRKGKALAAHPRASVIFHWDSVGRQVRMEGPVVHSPDSESDAYFRSRRVESRIGAWASDQSEPIEGRTEMLMKVLEKLRDLGVDLDDLENAEVPRPPHWGGYRLWAERVELWLNSDSRIHDRAQWTRDLKPVEGGFDAGPWVGTRLQP